MHAHILDRTSDEPAQLRIESALMMEHVITKTQAAIDNQSGGLLKKRHGCVIR